MITTAENADGVDIVVGKRRRRIGLRQLFLFFAGLTILFLLLRLLRLLLGDRLLPDERPRTPHPAQPSTAGNGPPSSEGDGPPSSPRMAHRRRARATGKAAAQAPKRRSRQSLADRLLLAAEIAAVVLFVGAAIAAWQTLGELNDAYRNLQRVDARVLPTVMPAADPGRLMESLAQSREQDQGLFSPLSLLPAPALPTPIPTSTPPPAPTDVAPVAAAPTAAAPSAAAPAMTGSGLGWGTSVVMSAPSQAFEQARRIHIPSIAVDSFVYQDYGPDWLKLGVVQFGEKISPGQPGNLVLAAHNDIYGEIFRDLDQLEPGEEVSIFSDHRRYTYRVRDTVIVEPTDTWVTLPTSSSTLTLISCYPYLVGTQRIVVFADLAQ